MPISLRTPVIAAAFVLLAALTVVPKASAQLPERAHVSRIVVSGNTVLQQQDIDAVIAPYLNRDLDADAIEDLRRALTLAYIKHDYIASGAVVPRQDIAGGTLTIDVVEGYLVGIDVSAVRVDQSGRDQAVPNRSSLQQYVCDRLALPPGGLLARHPTQRRVDVRLCERTASIAEGPLNMDLLQHRVAELLQDPNIARLNVEVRPGSDIDVATSTSRATERGAASPPGQALIDAKVVENRRWSLYTSIANDQPPNVGAMYGEIGGTVRNLLSYGDAVSLTYGKTDGANIASARYDIPLTRYDTRLGIFANYNGAGVVSSAFSGLGITSRYVSTGIEMIQPLLRDETQTLNASLSWDYTISDESLLGQPFSFSAGYVNGQAEAAQVHASLDWTHRTEVQVISLRGTFTHGLNILGATNLPSAPNADFSSGLAQAQYARRFGAVQVIGRLAGQFSSQALYPFEQVAIGGATTVRGYVQNALVRDSGLIGSIELRGAVGRIPIPLLSTEEKDGGINLCAFFDEGQGWNHHGDPSPGPGGISSVGLGLQWELSSSLHAQVYYGYGLIRPHNAPDFLQPVSFKVSKEF